MKPEIYVFADLETTGLDDREDAIVELGLIRVEDGVETDRICGLVNPGPHFIRRAHPKAWEVNGIEPDCLKDYDGFFAFAPDVASLLVDATFVAHNATFDAAFLRRAFIRLGAPPPRALHRTVCTRQLAREHLFPLGLRSTAMDKVRAFLTELEVPGWEVGGGTHRAERDAEDCWDLFDLTWRTSRDELVAKLAGLGVG